MIKIYLHEGPVLLLNVRQLLNLTIPTLNHDFWFFFRCFFSVLVFECMLCLFINVRLNGKGVIFFGVTTISYVLLDSHLTDNIVSYGEEHIINSILREWETNKKYNIFV